MVKTDTLPNLEMLTAMIPLMEEDEQPEYAEKCAFVTQFMYTNGHITYAEAINYLRIAYEYDDDSALDALCIIGDIERERGGSDIVEMF